MAQVRFTDLTALDGSGLDAAADLIPLVDSSAAVGSKNKTITPADLLEGMAPYTISRGGGSVTINADGSITLTPAAGKQIDIDLSQVGGSRNNPAVSFHDASAPAGWNPKTYIGGNGQVITNAWIAAVGTAHASSDPDLPIPLPTADPSMVIGWSDIDGPCFLAAVGNNGASEHYFSFVNFATGSAVYDVSIRKGGVFWWGASTYAAQDTNLYRGAADMLKTDDKLIAVAGIGVGNSAAATTPGNVVRRIEVFDASGASIGFVPVYDAIT